VVLQRNQLDLDDADDAAHLDGRDRIVILSVRALSAPREKGDAAMEALRQRLAAGQITAEEYERTTKILRS